VRLEQAVLPPARRARADVLAHPRATAGRAGRPQRRGSSATTGRCSRRRGPWPRRLSTVGANRRSRDPRPAPANSPPPRRGRLPDPDPVEGGIAESEGFPVDLLGWDPDLRAGDFPPCLAKQRSRQSPPPPTAFCQPERVLGKKLHLGWSSAEPTSSTCWKGDLGRYPSQVSKGTHATCA
jgi:hypothetical protein